VRLMVSVKRDRFIGFIGSSDAGTASLLARPGRATRQGTRCAGQLTSIADAVYVSGARGKRPVPDGESIIRPYLSPSPLLSTAIAYCSDHRHRRASTVFRGQQRSRGKRRMYGQSRGRVAPAGTGVAPSNSAESGQLVFAHKNNSGSAAARTAEEVGRGQLRGTYLLIGGTSVKV
jgi:hypothetical protein